MREQIPRSERRLHGDHLVEILRLADWAERVGLLDRRHADHATFRHFTQRVARPCEMCFAIAEVGAERDVGHVNHPLRSTATSVYASGPGSATCGFLTATRAQRMRGLCAIA